MALPPIPSVTGGAGGSAGPSEAGGHLSNPFATGDMAISYGGSAFTAGKVQMLVIAGAALAGVWLWNKYLK